VYIQRYGVRPEWDATRWGFRAVRGYLIAALRENPL